MPLRSSGYVTGRIPRMVGEKTNRQLREQNNQKRPRLFSNRELVHAFCCLVVAGRWYINYTPTTVQERYAMKARPKRQLVQVSGKFAARVREALRDRTPNDDPSLIGAFVVMRTVVGRGTLKHKVISSPVAYNTIRKLLDKGENDE